MILTIPGTRNTRPVTLGVFLVDRLGRLNPCAVVLIGWRDDLKAFAAFTLRPVEKVKRLHFARYD